MKMRLLHKLRDLPGVMAKDFPRYLKAVRNSGAGYSSDPEGWISLCNRAERLERGLDGVGVKCNWEHGSSLHAPLVVPMLGNAILTAALAEWPIEFSTTPCFPAGDQTVSFIFTHAGEDRLPQLLRTIESINAQTGVSCEIVVVDQSRVSICEKLPTNVKRFRLGNSDLNEGWRKSWGFNVGARIARGNILVFQDGDVCMPSRYAFEIVRALAVSGYGAASLQRFLFYLDAVSTRRISCKSDALRSARIEVIRQNWKGGTIAIRRDAFHAIGGFDEGFVDWGGEDVEFYDRCHEIRHLRAGYLPFIHLWHAPQANRKAADNVNTAHVLPSRLKIPRAQRAAELRHRDWGNPLRPDPVERYG
ncbi:MAG TPA: galactosyltransferase-related protein [Thermomonas sp.]|nr:galactosyltransferase-related protein [Thermomonas sp.]